DMPPAVARRTGRRRRRAVRSAPAAPPRPAETPRAGARVAATESRCGPPLEWQVPCRVRNVLVHGGALALEIACHGRPESLVRQPVGRRGGGRFETARELVFALRARVEGLEPMLDAMLDALVVA